MRVRAIKKAALYAVRDEEWVDPDRRPYVKGDTAWVPVREGFSFEREIPDRHRYGGPGYFMLGDVAVVHGPRPNPGAVDEIVGFRHPRGVVWIEALADVTRTPRTEILWGECGEVCHRESGYTYYLDPQKVMFSQGNREEKMRMARLVSEKNERVADMFAGIGYFTVPVAGSGAVVHAMEINPVAFGYLKRNIAANNLGDRVEASCGDCRNLLTGEYDRVVMGHFDAVEMLPSVFSHVRAGSVLHVHSIGEQSAKIGEALRGAGFSFSIQVHKVKKYRPHAWHVVQDVTLA
ncbi:class I SAM-dependent methyltransferase [Methanoregula sp. UBA64]|jgi:tRNA wybutosine-synthesizing protein 2|uniref:class I SAM-dependent methyltransferase n=1 Tax=Methanoregula sp. UBA64 TaxID=1915554 RepID=UPI0025F61EBC|nr:methyltransferase [Methanoregula sp. UBA64]